MKSKLSFRSLNAFSSRFIREESGAEVVEAVLVFGLIAVICLVAVKAVGPKIGIRWNTISDSVGSSFD